jgi:hypothetical protein
VSVSGIRKEGIGENRWISITKLIAPFRGFPLPAARQVTYDFLVYRCGHGSAYVQPLLPQRRGKAVFLPDVCLTGERQGPVHLALAHPHDKQAPGLIVSDELMGRQTLSEYGRRFDSEENCLEDKSNPSSTVSTIST